MRWAKEQGGVTGYAHSASGLAIDPPAMRRPPGGIITWLDTNKDGKLIDRRRPPKALLPEPFAADRRRTATG